MTTEWVTIYQAEDHLEALALQAALEQEGIPVQAIAHASETAIGGFPPPTWGLLRVPAAYEAAAEQIVEQFTDEHSPQNGGGSDPQHTPSFLKVEPRTAASPRARTILVLVSVALNVWLGAEYIQRCG